MLRTGLPDLTRPQLYLLLALLLVNAVLLAAVLGLFGADPLSGWFETPREPQRLQQQVRAERMQLQAPGSAPRSALPASAVVVASLHSARAGSADESRCVEIGGFSAQAVRRAADALAGSTLRVEQFERQEQVRWWIHLPAQPTRENVERKLSELRRRNVTDYSVVTTGAAESEAFIVSLGRFRDRERAERYLETLRGHGVRTAVLADAPRLLARPWLRVRGVDDAVRTRLEEMREHYGAEDLQSCSNAQAA